MASRRGIFLVPMESIVDLNLIGSIDYQYQE